MIDTIKLLLTNSYEITNYNLFKNFYPNYLRGFFEAPYTQYNGRKSLSSWFLHIIDGIYRLRLSILKNPFISYPQLYIEFSIPKLLFGNNLYEVCKEDFNTVVQQLLTILKNMGVETAELIIRTAIVKKIDFAKNFILSDDLLCSIIFEVLRKSKFPHLNLLQPEYSYGGVKFNSKGLKVIFYSKIIEMLLKDRVLAENLLNIGINKDAILRVKCRQWFYR